MPFGVKSLEKRQNELIQKLFPDGNGRSSVNATRLVVRAFELRILDVDSLEPDDEWFHRVMNKILAYIAIVLGVLEIVLVLASWMLSVLLPDSGIRSMLDGEGIRWFFGGFVDMLAGPVLVWILLLSIAVGCFYGSGLACVFRSGYSLRYRERIALTLVGILLLVYAGAFGLLAFIPHAVLLSASGHIFPSPFSSSIVPVVAFGVTSLSVVYGIVSARFCGMEDVYKSLFKGIGMFAPFFLFYILLAQLYHSVVFVFG